MCKFRFLRFEYFYSWSAVVATVMRFCVQIFGWSGGAMVLGKLPVPGRPTDLDYSRARAYCACGRCGWGFVWICFLSTIISSFSHSLGDGPI